MFSVEFSFRAVQSVGARPCQLGDSELLPVSFACPHTIWRCPEQTQAQPLSVLHRKPVQSVQQFACRR